MIGPWQFAGDRFVATRRLKDAALPGADRHDARPAHRVVPRGLLGARRPPRRVEPLGRRPGQLPALATGGCSSSASTCTRCSTRSAGRSRATRTACTIELALDHGYPGLVVVCGDVEGRPHPRRGRRLVPRARTCPTRWRSRGAPTSSARTRRCRCSTTGPPTCVLPDGRARTGSCSSTSSTTTPRRGGPTATPRIGEAIEASGLATHVWTAPFIQTVFGTDTYTDELW